MRVPRRRETPSAAADSYFFLWKIHFHTLAFFRGIWYNETSSGLAENREEGFMAREITKLVFKTMLVTLLSIVGVAVVFFLIISFTAPAAMARLTRDLGMYSQSAWFSSLQYADGRGDIENIELAMTCSSLAGDEAGVAEYGAAFIADSRFAEYCTAREEEEAGKYRKSYTQFVYGRVSIAYYRIGEKEDGLELALSVNRTSFDEYNAVTDLVNEVIVKGDKSFGGEILVSLTELGAADSVAAEDVPHLQSVIDNLTRFTA